MVLDFHPKEPNLPEFHLGGGGGKSKLDYAPPLLTTFQS